MTATVRDEIVRLADQLEHHLHGILHPDTDIRAESAQLLKQWLWDNKVGLLRSLQALATPDAGKTGDVVELIERVDATVKLLDGRFHNVMACGRGHSEEETRAVCLAAKNVMKDVRAMLAAAPSQPSAPGTESETKRAIRKITDEFVSYLESDSGFDKAAHLHHAIRGLQARIATAIAQAVAGERERACDVLERMKPPGGRQWTSEQLACYSCLTDAQAAIRA